MMIMIMIMMMMKDLFCWLIQNYSPWYERDSAFDRDGTGQQQSVRLGLNRWYNGRCYNSP